MTRKVAIVAAVAAALVAILWLKPLPPAAPKTETPTSSTRPRASVLLFADPREAESRCGCAEIIRLARSAKKIPGVRLEELDPRQRTDEARRYRVRLYLVWLA